MYKMNQIPDVCGMEIDGERLNCSQTTLRSIWSEFRMKTTTHGVSHVTTARGMCKTTMWVFGTAVSVSLLFMILWEIRSKYYSHDVSVKVSVAHKARLLFPAVTVCNQNPVRHSEAINRMNLLKSYDKIKEKLNSSFTKSHMKPKTKNQYPVEKHSWKMNRNITERHNKKTKILNIISQMGLSEKVALGHRFKDFILQCEYSGYECIETDFKTFYNPIYGNCWIFNSGWIQRKEPLHSSNPGPDFGLDITFNIDQQNYNPDLSEAAGVRIVIHHQDRMPFPEDEGLSVLPGTKTFIGLRKLNIKRKGGKYGDCIQPESQNHEHNVFEEHYGVNYSSAACYKTCHQTRIMAECNCGDSQYPMYGKAFEKYGNANETLKLKPCDMSDPMLETCIDKILSLSKTHPLYCYCPQPCEETTYITSLSTSSWPSIRSMKMVIEKFMHKLEQSQDILVGRKQNKVRENLAKIVIYFEDFNYETIEEFPAYEVKDLLSHGGALLSLFLGFSLLTILELLELVLELSMMALIKIFAKKRQPAQVSTINLTNVANCTQDKMTNENTVINTFTIEGPLQQNTNYLEDIPGSAIYSFE